MSKTVSIQIQGQCFNITTSENELDLRKIAAQFDILVGQVAKACPTRSRIEHLVLVGLEQQDQICTLKKEIAELQDKLDHYNIGEGLGCIADYRESLALVNQKTDALQRENDALRKENDALHAQLKQTFETLTQLAAHSADSGKDNHD